MPVSAALEYLREMCRVVDEKWRQQTVRDEGERYLTTGKATDSAGATTGSHPRFVMAEVQQVIGGDKFPGGAAAQWRGFGDG